MRQIGRSLEPEFMRRDAPVMVDELELDKPQSQIVEVLIMDYETAFSAAAAP